MARQVGSTLGVALLVVVLGTPGTPAETLLAYRRGWLLVAVSAGLAALASLAFFRRDRAPDPL